MVYLSPRVEREHETSWSEQLVPWTHPDRRPLLLHQPVFHPNWSDPAAGGSAAPCVPWLHAHQQTQPAPQRRFITHHLCSILILPSSVWDGFEILFLFFIMTLIDVLWQVKINFLFQEICMWAQNQTCPWRVLRDIPTCPPWAPQDPLWRVNIEEAVGKKCIKAYRVLLLLFFFFFKFTLLFSPGHHAQMNQQHMMPSRSFQMHRMPPDDAPDVDEFDWDSIVY